MTSEDLTSRVFEPAREYIQSALESGEITASDDLADSLADVLHTATQKHLAEYRKPLYARDIVGRMYSTASAREYLNLTVGDLEDEPVFHQPVEFFLGEVEVFAG